MKLNNKIDSLLNWAGKKFKIDAKYFAKGGFWLFLKQAAGSLSAFFLSIAFANLLPKEIFGSYKYIISTAGMLAIFSLGGINASLSRSVARGFKGSLNKILQKRQKWAVLGSLVCLLFSGYYFFFNGDQTLALGFLVAGFFIPLLEPLTLYSAYLLGRKDFKRQSLLNSLEIIVNFIFVALAVFFLPKTIWLILAYFLSYSFIRIIIWIKIIKKIKTEEDLEEEKNVVSYGKHLTIMSVASEIAKYLDKIIIFNFLGPVDLAVYTISTSAPNQITSLINKASDLLFPKFAGTEEKRLKKTMFKKIALLFFAVLLLAVLYIAIAPWVFKLIFPKFLEGIFYSQIFAVSIITTIVLVPSTFLQAQKKIKKLYIASFVSPFLNITILLISAWFGLLGIIIGRVIFRFINTIFLFILARK